MLTEYLEAAMQRAKYQQVPGEGIFFGKIPGFKGLWASAPTKTACATELRESLDEWIVLSLRLNLTLPVVKGVNLNKTLSPVKAA